MSLFNDFDEITEFNHSLAEHTWYGLGGPAEFFIRPRNVDELSAVVARCRESEVPIHVMGFGSNLLVSDDGVPGAVIRLDRDEFVRTEFDGEQVIAWAGAELGSLVLTCVKKGLSGLEALAGIPGSIGGAIKMNAGGRFGDIGSVVESATLMDSSGGVFEKSKPELIFDYRSTNITAKVILSARVCLTEADPDQIMRTVKEGWMYKKNSQPLNTRSCGCVFKNPPGQSAGSIIDRAGLKGLQIGGAIVSEKHANFIVAGADCTSRNVADLIMAVQAKVKEQFDIELETEIEIWP